MPNETYLLKILLYSMNQEQQFQRIYLVLPIKNMNSNILFYEFFLSSLL